MDSFCNSKHTRLVLNIHLQYDKKTRNRLFRIVDNIGLFIPVVQPVLLCNLYFRTPATLYSKQPTAVCTTRRITRAKRHLAVHPLVAPGVDM